MADWNIDSRPARGGWAPGYYTFTCARCGKITIGDKRAVCCADCAYAGKTRVPVYDACPKENKKS